MDEAGVAHVEADCDALATRLTAEVAADARRACPVDTGELLESIHDEHHAIGIGRVYVGTGHWASVEYGSRPHDIRAHNPNGALHFFWLREGRDVFFRSIHHPGTLAQPFMRSALFVARAL